MPWMDNGVTNERVLLDQAPTITWGQNFTRVGARAFNQVGYLKRVRAKIPITATTVTEASGTNLLVAQNAINRPAYRAINSLSIVAQGIAPLYQLGSGVDLSLLEYMRNGKNPFQEEALGLVPDTPGTTTFNGTAFSTGVLARPAASLNAMAYDVAVGATFGAFSQNIRFGATYDLPLTEWVQFPATVQQTPNGPVPIPAQMMEVGLVTLQSTQQNVVPQISLNPLFVANGVTDGPFQVASGALPTAGSLSVPVELWTEFYDVPANPADQPPAFTQAWVITRTSTDDGVSGGAVTHTFQPAGLLLKAGYLFYDTNNNLVDVSNQGVQALPASALAAQTAEGTITFSWGATVIKYGQERFTHNLLRAFQTYGEPPPVGCLIHDFFNHNNNQLTDVINTATLTAVRTQIAGLPAAVTRMHTVETRMIPVRLGA